MGSCGIVVGGFLVLDACSARESLMQFRVGWGEGSWSDREALQSLLGQASQGRGQRFLV